MLMMPATNSHQVAQIILKIVMWPKFGKSNCSIREDMWHGEKK